MLTVYFVYVIFVCVHLIHNFLSQLYILCVFVYTRCMCCIMYRVIRLYDSF